MKRERMPGRRTTAAKLVPTPAGRTARDPIASAGDPAAELLAGRPNLLLQPRGPFRDHGCAITTGAFYTPQQGQFPSVYPECYFFADVCKGWIRGYDIADDSASELATGVKFSVDLDVSEGGYLFYLSRRTGGTTTASRAITRVSYPAL